MPSASPVTAKRIDLAAAGFGAVTNVPTTLRCLPWMKK
jgi:hypothetical protein